MAEKYDDGMRVRRQVLGEAYVDERERLKTPFEIDFQRFITETAWGGIWTRPGLDRRTRSLLTIAMMACLGHHEELALHIRASRNTGASKEDIKEVLLQVAVYGGVPAANAAMRITKGVFAEWDRETESLPEVHQVFAGFGARPAGEKPSARKAAAKAARPAVKKGAAKKAPAKKPAARKAKR
jgi:4-carboxymuconolactone decarboxylase